MTRRALVIGGAGRVGRGGARAFQDEGFEVVVVDPAGGDPSAAADPEQASRIGPVDAAVISLAARGRGRPEGDFRPAEVAAAQLGPRLAAVELATKVLDGGPMIELAGGAALDPGADEAGLIGRWQRGVHAGLAQAGVQATLCAITCFVDPEADAEAVGRQIVRLAVGGRTGLCRLDGTDVPVEWVD
jgi:hypothetical protein